MKRNTDDAPWLALAARCRSALRVATLLCAASVPVHVDAESLGHTQAGSLPRPGLFTFFKLADTEGLLQFPAGGSPDDRLFPKRGIVYTKRAGVVDLAHVFNTVLVADYATHTVAAALRKGQNLIRLRDVKGSEVSILLPPPSPDPPDAVASSGQEVEAVSRITGACIAYELGTWHEIITWFGYSATGVWSEKPSAFTYEDIVSHLVGLQVFAAISGEPDRAKFGVAIRRVFADLELVDRKLARKAIYSVQGLWWGPRLYTRRLLDIDNSDGLVHPWTVPGVQEDLHDVDGPVSMAVPCTKMPAGYSLRIVPSAAILRRIRKSDPGTPAVIDTQKDFPVLLRVIRAEVSNEMGSDALNPG